MSNSQIRTVSVYVFKIASEGPRYLALHRREEIDRLGGTWQAVHGGVAAGETAIEAALRELTEETGAKPLRLWQIDFVESFYLAHEDKIEFVPCFGALITGDVVLGSEHDDLVWLPLGKIQEAFVWRNQRVAIQQLHDGIAVPLINNAPINPCTEIELAK